MHKYLFRNLKKNQGWEYSSLIRVLALVIHEALDSILSTVLTIYTDGKSILSYCRDL
jgi:hypothetical protein